MVPFGQIFSSFVVGGGFVWKLLVLKEVDKPDFSEMETLKSAKSLKN